MVKLYNGHGGLPDFLTNDLTLDLV